jgi:hypothetical protein
MNGVDGWSQAWNGACGWHRVRNKVLSQRNIVSQCGGTKVELREYHQLIRWYQGWNKGLRTPSSTKINSNRGVEQIPPRENRHITQSIHTIQSFMITSAHFYHRASSSIIRYHTALYYTILYTIVRRSILYTSLSHTGITLKSDN